LKVLSKIRLIFFFEGGVLFSTPELWVKFYFVSCISGVISAFRDSQIQGVRKVAVPLSHTT
jgi:hypothetical protein